MSVVEGDCIPMQYRKVRARASCHDHFPQFIRDYEDEDEDEDEYEYA